MTQLTSFSSSNFHFFSLFILLLIFINNQKISANSLSNKSDYQRYPSTFNDLSYDDNESPISINPNSLYMPDSDEVVSQNPWSQLFHHHYDRPILSQTYYSAPTAGFALRRGEIRYGPYQRRAIPIELQKALFAHGIVGRRR